MAAHAQIAAASAEADDGEAIVVTGLRGLSSKTAVESPAPIDIVPADRLTGTGRQEIGEALARTLPSINFGRTGAGVASTVRPIRSEERRVGKECVSTCTSRWAPYH